MRILQGRETIPYDTVTADTCHYIFVDTKNKPKGKLWTLGDNDASMWVISLLPICPSGEGRRQWKGCAYVEDLRPFHSIL